MIRIALHRFTALKSRTPFAPTTQLHRSFSSRSFSSTIPDAPSGVQTGAPTDAPTSYKKATPDKIAPTVPTHINPNSVDVEVGTTLSGKERLMKKELSRGAFWELAEIRDNKGKIFESHRCDPIDIPDLENTIELTTSATTTLHKFLPKDPFVIYLSFNQFGFDMLKTWQGEDTDAAVLPSTITPINIVISPGGLMSLFKSFLIPSLKKVIPEVMHDTTCLHYGNAEEFRTGLEIPNKLTGYVLGGYNGQIHFRGCGKAGEGDVELLRRVCGELVGEWREGGAGGGREKGRKQQRNSKKHKKRS